MLLSTQEYLSIACWFIILHEVITLNGGDLKHPEIKLLTRVNNKIDFVYTFDQYYLLPCSIIDALRDPYHRLAWCQYCGINLAENMSLYNSRNSKIANKISSMLWFTI